MPRRQLLGAEMVIFQREKHDCWTGWCGTVSMRISDTPAHTISTFILLYAPFESSSVVYTPANADILGCSSAFHVWHLPQSQIRAAYPLLCCPFVALVMAVHSRHK